MPIDWNSPLQTRHDKPRPAKLLDGRGPGGQRRVAIIGDFSARCKDTNPASKVLTTFLFSEDGIVRCDGAPSDMDLVNVADTLAQAA